MAVTEKLEYKITTLDGVSSSNKEVSIALNIPQKNPKYLLHRAVVIQDNNARQGNASTKTRSEVRAGGKKPWKQKGTGQARSGSKNSPLWNGGGVAFGPKPRSYRKKINNKEWRLALQTALYTSKNKITIVEDFTKDVQDINTQKFVKKLGNILNIKTKTVLIIKENNPTITLSVRNLKDLTLLTSNALNIKDILGATNIIITSGALENIEKIYHD
nr:ribosomal protein L4 [Chroomonas debatzensis]